MLLHNLKKMSINGKFKGGPIHAKKEKIKLYWSGRGDLNPISYLGENWIMPSTRFLAFFYAHIYLIICQSL